MFKPALSAKTIKLHRILAKISGLCGALCLFGSFVILFKYPNLIPESGIAALTCGLTVLAAFAVVLNGLAVLDMSASATPHQCSLLESAIAYAPIYAYIQEVAEMGRSLTWDEVSMLKKKGDALTAEIRAEQVYAWAASPFVA